MPQQPKRFTDLYQRIIDQISSDDLVDLGRAPGLPNELSRAIRVLQHGSSDEKHLIRTWLEAGTPPLRDLKAASGIGSRISDDARACEMLCDIAGAFRARGRRLVVLLDEFQRISAISEKQRNTLLSHLRTVFSRNASQFSVVLAVASRIERTATMLLPPELRTLVGLQPMISLPEMSRDEALDFVRGRLAAHRPAGYVGEPAAPFGEAALAAAVEFIVDRDSARLIPRTVLQALAHLYDEAYSISPASTLTAARTRELLGELCWDE
jgi:Cdc6-like AAA superfamily ATPase